MHMATKASALPAGVLVPLHGAVKRISATPTERQDPPRQRRDRRSRSWKSSAANGTTITGTRLPMNSALATLVLVTATKNSARSVAKKNALGPASRTARVESRPPAAWRTIIQMAGPEDEAPASRS